MSACHAFCVVAGVIHMKEAFQCKHFEKYLAFATRVEPVPQSYSTFLLVMSVSKSSFTRKKRESTSSMDIAQRQRKYKQRFLKQESTAPIRLRKRLPSSHSRGLFFFFGGPEKVVWTGSKLSSNFDTIVNSSSVWRVDVW